LLPVAESAADLLTVRDLSLLRKCENPACVLFFYDTTKNDARRWCSMPSAATGIRSPPTTAAGAGSDCQGIAPPLSWPPLLWTLGLASPEAAVTGDAMYLYEAHLPVTNTEASKAFYVGTVGLAFAYRDPTRDIVFLWVGGDRRSMLGLWGPGTEFGTPLHKCHIAVAISLSELLSAATRLNRSGVRTFNFAGEQTAEPSVIGWMPSAQLYFRDPDGHLLELITPLEHKPDASFIGPLGSWLARLG
jgi:lactoylglutathione lyase